MSIMHNRREEPARGEGGLSTLVPSRLPASAPLSFPASSPLWPSWVVESGMARMGEAAAEFGNTLEQFEAIIREQLEFVLDEATIQQGFELMNLDGDGTLSKSECQAALGAILRPTSHTPTAVPRDEVLVSMVRAGRTEDAVRLLAQEERLDINQIRVDGKPLVLRCIEMGQVEFAKELVQNHKADPNTNPHGTTTILVAAILGGHLRLARWLVEHGGADVNLQPHDSNLGFSHDSEHGGRSPGSALMCHTALMCAIQCDMVHMAGWLLAHGANPNDMAAPGLTDFHHRISRGTVPSSALSLAISHRNIQLARELITARADPNTVEQLQPARPHSPVKRHSKGIRRAGRVRLRTTSRHRTCGKSYSSSLSSDESSSDSDGERVVRLGDDSSEPEPDIQIGSPTWAKKSLSPPPLSSQYPNQKVKDPPVGQSVVGSTALLVAVDQDLFLLARELVAEHHVDVNVVSLTGNSCLKAAVDKGNLGLMECLVEHGAHLNKVEGMDDISDYDMGYGMNRFPESCLSASFRRQDLRAATLLLRHGARPDRQGVETHGCFIRNLVYKNARLVILSHKKDTGKFGNLGADLVDLIVYNMCESSGLCDSEALASAIENGWTRLAGWLLDHGADPNRPYCNDSLGPTTLQWNENLVQRSLLGRAVILNRSEIATKLVQHGATLNGDHGAIPVSYTHLTLPTKRIV
eukprot:TRINITY_DN1827_c0_g1_i2.p1 TRINITY_DN1827_c0_g1~~TRINITY_DN1827_c0_g1_i2.p1  ORF type:complete len:695 (-),score=98.92 TRINITY_DN1827_c0_g1_i2:167-2251(-)